MAEASTSAPAPSTHIFLSDLPTCAVGNKVRFLCCIQEIDERNALLEVQHRYPPDLTSTPKILVNYDLVRQTVKRDDLQIGSWINVIGYIRDIIRASKPLSTTRSLNSRAVVSVQAVLIWSAGAINVNEYERVLQEQKMNRTERDILSNGGLQK